MVTISRTLLPSRDYFCANLVIAFNAVCCLSRKDLSEAQKNCEDLSGRLKHQQMLNAANSSNKVGGLCLKCAQHVAVLSQTHSDVHMQTIERLTK